MNITTILTLAILSLSTMHACPIEQVFEQNIKCESEFPSIPEENWATYFYLCPICRYKSHYYFCPRCCVHPNPWPWNPDWHNPEIPNKRDRLPVPKPWVIDPIPCK